MNLIEYSSDMYGRKPNIYQINTNKVPTQPGAGGGQTGDDETIVKPPETKQISEFTFLVVIGLVLFLMWK